MYLPDGIGLKAQNNTPRDQLINEEERPQQNSDDIVRTPL